MVRMYNPSEQILLCLKINAVQNTCTERLIKSLPWNSSSFTLLQLVQTGDIGLQYFWSTASFLDFHCKYLSFYQSRPAADPEKTPFYALFYKHHLEISLGLYQTMVITFILGIVRKKVSKHQNLTKNDQQVSSYGKLDIAI